MTDPYEQDRKDLADALALFMVNTGVSDFVLPDFLAGRTLAFGSPGFIEDHVDPNKSFAHRVADLGSAQREHERAMNDCDRSAAEYWAWQIKRCERNLARK